MLADEVALDRLVGAGGQERGFGQQLDLQRQQVAEDARQRDDHVHARPTQRVQRQQLGAGQAAVAVEARLGADQCQGLADRCAFGLQVVGAPQHQRDAFREGVAVGAVPLQQPLGLLRAVLHRIGAGDAEGVEAVQVAAGGQDRRRAQQVAAGGRAHEAAVQRMHQAGDLVCPWRAACRWRPVRRRASALRHRPPCRRWPARAAGVWPATSASTASRAGCWPCEASATDSSMSMRSRSRGRLADDVQAVRDQRVFEFEHRRRSSAAIFASASSPQAGSA